MWDAKRMERDYFESQIKTAQSRPVDSRKTLIIVRGLPGSGKTTWAKSQKGLNFHFEADQYFEQGGVYRYDPLLIKYAHEWCRAMVARALLFQSMPVIVSNTFTTLAEIQPYIAIAGIYNARIEFVECHGNYGSVHNVPQAVIDNMRARWENLPAGCEVHHVGLTQETCNA